MINIKCIMPYVMSVIRPDWAYFNCGLYVDISFDSMITVSYNIIIVLYEQIEEEKMSEDNSKNGAKTENLDERKQIELAWLQFDFLRKSAGLLLM